MKNNWKLYKQKYEDIINQLLANRGVDISARENYLSPSFEENFDDPKNLPDFKIFIERIKNAVKNNEVVGIFADYDADGIPGAAFLKKVLDQIGLKSNIHIPSREEGYGLSRYGIDKLISKGCTLIITVDLGIRNNEEIEYCNGLNVDVIVTDHHIPGEKIPKALAVINPKINTRNAEHFNLSGAGVVFILAYGMMNEFPNITLSFLKWNLDLVAISTISDVVPLTGENRIIAKYGLIVLGKTKNIGIKYLIEKAKINKLDISVYDVGFLISPRINAPGRISSPEDSYELLITSDLERAEALAEKLDLENNNRQKMMDKLIEDAMIFIENESLDKDKIIVLAGNWQKGILGPCASRIAEKYTRPVILFSCIGDEMTGSARSYSNISIIDIIEKSSRYLKKFGGHTGAAGLTLSPNKYINFKKDIINTSEKVISDKDLCKKYDIDKEIYISEIDFDLYKNIKEFEPFGIGNPKPIFLSKNVSFENCKSLGKNGGHLSFLMKQNEHLIKSIYFNSPVKINEIKKSRNIDVIYSIDMQTWNGNQYLQLKVIDIDIKKN